jgi:hypothetical protein
MARRMLAASLAAVRAVRALSLSMTNAGNAQYAHSLSIRL